MDLESVQKKLRSLGFTGGSLGKGDADSTRALAAFSLIDKDNNVVLDADNLAATLANLLALTPAPQRAQIADLILSDQADPQTDAKAEALMSGVAVLEPVEGEAKALPQQLRDFLSSGAIDGVAAAKLRSLLSGQFGIRLQSTGDTANREQTRIVMQTIGASPTHPYLVEFAQFILSPFTGPGQFDLVERDMSDVLDGESQVAVATKSGFTDGDTTGGWSRFAKVITVDKIYSVIFVPGTAGDGIYSIKVRHLGRNQ